MRRIRNARGLSLAQVAEATAISRSLLSLIETGRSDITIGRLGRLAQLQGTWGSQGPRPGAAAPRPAWSSVAPTTGPLMHYDSGRESTSRCSSRKGPTRCRPCSRPTRRARGWRTSSWQTNEQFVYLLEGGGSTHEFADGREFELAAGDSATFISGEGGHKHTNLVNDVSSMVIVIRRTQPR